MIHLEGFLAQVKTVGHRGLRSSGPLLCKGERKVGGGRKGKGEREGRRESKQCYSSPWNNLPDKTELRVGLTHTPKDFFLFLNPHQQ